jgi:hypothetical protein
MLNSLLLRRVMNRIRPCALDAAAQAVREVAPAAEIAGPPAFCLPGAFDQIMAVVNGDRALEWARVSGAPQRHLPTIEYRLANARLRRDCVTAGRYLGRFRTSRPRNGARADRGAPLVLDQALLSTNILSGLEFGHWVRDSLVTEMHAEPSGMACVALPREPWPHEPDFRAMSGLSCRYPAEARVGTLLILDDRGHNAYWRQRFSQLRERTRRSASDGASESAGPLIFLSRGGGARSRDPVNIGEIEALLIELGFRTVVPSAMSIPAVARAMRDARVVVSVEGSNLNHLHFFAPDAVALVSLQDPRRFYAYHKGVMDLYDGRFGFVVGRPNADLADRYDIDPGDLQRTLDLVR